MCEVKREKKKQYLHGCSQKREAARWRSSYAWKVQSQESSLQKSEDVAALRMFSISPAPPIYHHHHHHIITDPLLNCQIELSGGHLFNKYCLVYCNEKERMFFFFFYQRGASLKKIKIFIKNCWNETVWHVGVVRIAAKSALRNELGYNYNIFHAILHRAIRFFCYLNKVKNDLYFNLRNDVTFFFLGFFFFFF